MQWVWRGSIEANLNRASIKRRTMMSNTPGNPKESDTYQAIDSRLRRFNPPVKIPDHEAGLDVKADTLHGIDFVVKDREKLLAALRAAKDGLGQPAFAEGSKADGKNWALRASFLAKSGIGFREIWRLRLTDRPLRLPDPRLPALSTPSPDSHLSANFGDNLDLPDLSSLHCTVWDQKWQKVTHTKCNIHIDDMGFVMAGPDGEPVVNPDFLRHLIVEMGWKIKLGSKLPHWAADRINLIIPSSLNEYSRVGISFNLAKSKQYSLQVSGSCGIFGKFDCSGVINLTGTHDLLGGSR
jgi:hypothetical protein